MVTAVLQATDDSIEAAVAEAIEFAEYNKDSDQAVGELSRRFLAADWYEVLLDKSFQSFEKVDRKFSPLREVTIEATAWVRARSAAEAEEAVTDALDDGFPEIDYHVVAS